MKQLYIHRIPTYVSTLLWGNWTKILLKGKARESEHFYGFSIIKISCNGETLLETSFVNSERFENQNVSKVTDLSSDACTKILVKNIRLI